MTTIDFSLIPDTDSDFEAIARLMSAFKRDRVVDAILRRMEGGRNTWSQLTGIATQDLDSTMTRAMDSPAESLNPTLG
jgi:hypothetical protein